MSHRNTPNKFWSRVKRGSTEECWPWIGASTRQGYGTISYCGVHWRCNRLAYTLAHGPIPNGKYVCHHCDNPSCCNPTHLFIGTASDNTMDMAHKGRRTGLQAQVNRVRQHVARGERNGRAKLTQEKADAIRGRHANGQLMASLAHQYGVTVGAIWFIVKNKHWVRPVP